MTTARDLIKYGLLFGTIFPTLISPASATLREALDALNERDYTFAAEEFTRLAEKESDADARYYLGRMYEQGQGVDPDQFKAMEIYRKAAADGSEKAQLKIGNAYYTGQGEEKNYKEAFSWYSKAAGNNSFPAQYNIALMYEEGLGVKKDVVKSFSFYKKSADQGYAPAQMALGRMYLKGVGTPQDFSQAVFWYKLAADQGNSKAQLELADLYGNATIRGLPFNVVGAHTYYNLVAAYGTSPAKEEAAQKRDTLAKRMRSEEVSLAQGRAQKWKKKTREESLPRLVMADSLLDEGSGGKSPKGKNGKEPQKEIKLTIQTPTEDLIVAGGVSRRLLNKAVRENNFQPVIDALKTKADTGDRAALLALADVYVLGQGLESPNPLAALDIYQQLANERNDFIAFSKMGPMYCEGNGVTPDLAECYKYILLAQKYTDEDSLSAANGNVQMLDENLEKSIRDSGKQLADAWIARKETPKKEKKKKLFGNIFNAFSDDDDGAMEKPQDDADDKKSEERSEKKDDKKGAVVDDLFSDL